jgi:hypothetical protein
MSAGIIGFYYVFAASDPNHRCRLPDHVWPNDTHYYPVNQTHETLINTYIPLNKDDNKWERCVRYTTGHINETLTDCPNGWAYDRSVFGYTFTEEADFICRKETDKSWLATMMQCGGLSLLVMGSFADKYGRKTITSIVTVLLFTTCLITQIIIEWVPMSLQVKYLDQTKQMIFVDVRFLCLDLFFFF